MSAQLIILVFGPTTFVVTTILLCYLALWLHRRGQQGDPQLIAFFSIIVGLVGVVVTLFVGGSGVAASHSCSVAADDLGVEHQWSYAAGCQVQVGDRWVSIDRYRFALEELN